MFREIYARLLFSDVDVRLSNTLYRKQNFQRRDDGVGTIMHCTLLNPYVLQSPLYILNHSEHVDESNKKNQLNIIFWHCILRKCIFYL